MRILITMHDSGAREIVERAARSQLPDVEIVSVDALPNPDDGGFDLVVVGDAQGVGEALQKLKGLPVIVAGYTMNDVSQGLSVGATNGCLVWQEGELRRIFFKYKQ